MHGLLHRGFLRYRSRSRTYCTTAVKSVVILMHREAEMSFNFCISFSCISTIAKISMCLPASSSASANNSRARIMLSDSGVNVSFSSSSFSSSGLFEWISQRINLKDNTKSYLKLLRWVNLPLFNFFQWFRSTGNFFLKLFNCIIMDIDCGFGVSFAVTIKIH